MPRVKRGTTHVKMRKKLRKEAKGFKWGRKNTIRQAKTALKKAGAHAFVGRRDKKADFRAVWQIRIGAFVRELGLNYSKFINKLKVNKIELDRKILADLALNNKKIMAKIVEEVK